MITLEDKIAIQELIARFTRCSDYGDWEGLATVYTPDVEVEMEGLQIRYTGVEAQVEHAKESDRQAEGKNRHFNFNMIVSEKDGAVYAEYAFMNVNAGKAPMDAKIVVSGRQRDTVVKTGEGWKIAHRFIQFDQSFSLDF
ncbi:nuclear transport factor 2 family protein [Sphingobium agri]|uniref:Nuclear transport factor 2 family protein n=1 Tax=Sphingobium agri TaxID=2933566 RepID=A0ABT0E0R4_9SPHN|nr:nuclear transport factor 2 family protein [Sphingobium agri]MCK0532925.1 nuclear transport factor 2 family protein [Sphingobium agri]